MKAQKNQINHTKKLIMFFKRVESLRLLVKNGDNISKE